VGAVFIAIGLAGWWYNWHLRSTEGHFYIKLTLLGPMGLFGGLLMMLRPEWTGPITPQSTREHKIALGALIALVAICAGVDFYLLRR
jgi:hypothetical protein